MIYPNFGVSTFAHMAIVAVGKVNSLVGFRKNKNELKQGVIKKIFLSLFIAVILESVLFFVVGSSVLAVYVGIKSGRSNLNVIEKFYKTEIQNVTNKCFSNNVCYLKNNSPDAINFPG
jgi:hypothetical protein